MTPNLQVNLATGNLFGRFTTSRFYNQGLEPAHQVDFFFSSQAVGKVGDYTGGFSLGAGWSTTIGSRLDFPSVDEVLLTRANGTEVLFEEVSAGSWEAAEHWFLEMEVVGATWVVRERNQYEYHYDAGGALTKIQAPSGNRYEVVYDATGKAIASNEVLGASTPGRGASYVYDTAGRLERMTDSFSAEWDFHYDAAGLLEEIEDPVYGRLSFLYDGQGRLKEYTDFDGNSWSFKYRSGKWEDRLRSVWDPNRERMFLFSYDDEITTVTTRVTDIRGNVWKYRHSTAQSPALKRVESPLGFEHNYTRDRKLVTRYTNPLGHDWNMAYGGNGLLRQITDPEGHTVLYGYDALENLETVTVATDQTDLYYEDALLPTHLTKVEEPATATAPLAVTLLDSYDAFDGTLPGEWNGLAFKMTDAEGVETTFEYTGQGILYRTIEGPSGYAGRVVTQEGSVTLYPEATSMSYPSSFPDLPAISGETYPGVPAQIQGGLAWTDTSRTRWDWRGGYEILDLDLQVPIDTGSGFETSNLLRAYSYDHLGRLTGLSETTDEIHEHVSNPPATVPTRSYSVVYDDLAADARSEVTTPDGDIIVTLRDADGRVSEVFTNGGGVGELSSTYTYFADGSLQSETRGDGTSSHYTYYANGQVQSLEHKQGVTSMLRLEYQYDARGLPTRLIETSVADIVTRDFSYDERGRLTQESRALDSTGVTEATAFSYDQVGNRTSCSRSIDGLVFETSVYHYDQEDPAAYASDNNRLMWVEVMDGNSQVVETVWFFYDNRFGNVSRIVRKAAGATQVASTAFVFSEHGSPWLMWDETWDDFGSGPVNLVRGAVHETRQVESTSYLWRTRDASSLVPQGDAEWGSVSGFLASTYSVDGNDGTTLPADLLHPRLGCKGAGAVTTYGFDLVGATRLTQTAGTSNAQEYSAYGQVSTSLASPFGFAGAFAARSGFDGSALSANEIVKLGFRFYAPEWGRFLMRDPLGVSDGPNTYAFVHNQPTSLVDPDGRTAVPGGTAIRPKVTPLPLNGSSPRARVEGGMTQIKPPPFPLWGDADVGAQSGGHPVTGGGNYPGPSDTVPPGAYGGGPSPSSAEDEIGPPRGSSGSGSHWGSGPYDGILFLFISAN